MTLRTLTNAAFGLVLLATALAPPASAQAPGRKRFAIFISTLFTPQIWTESGTPEDWKQRGIVDGYLILDQNLQSLYQDFSAVQPGSQSSLVSFLNSSDELYLYISQCLRSQPVTGGQCSAAQGLFGAWANTDLIIVGHHIGGYVARTLGHAIEDRLMGAVPSWGSTIGGYPASVTVATVATPNQGFRAFGAQSETTRTMVNATLGRIEDVARDPDNRFWGIVWAAETFQNVDPDEINAIPDIIRGVRDYYNVGFGASQILGPLNSQSVLGENGSVIRFVNGLPPLDNYVSVYGAEREYVPARAASELLPAGLANQFGGVGNEAGLYQQYGLLNTYYDMNRMLWANCWAIMSGGAGTIGGLIGGIGGPLTGGIAGVVAGLGGGLVGCTIPGYNHKRDRWAAALQDLQTIDVLWANVINAKAYVTRTGYRWEQVCEPVGGTWDDGMRVSTIAASYLADPEISADLEPLMRRNMCAPGQSPYQYVPYTYSTLVPEANDGITGRTYARWSQSSNVDQNVTGGDPNNPQNGNAYFGTSGANGGYNVMELRRSKRAYGQGSRGGSATGVTFNAGDIADPLLGLDQWWFRRLRRMPT